MCRRSLTVVLLLLAALPLRADSWFLPRPQTYESANRKWRVVVTPKQLESQLAYFEDKVAGEADAGAAPGVADNRARAELSRREGRRWRRVKRWNLVNEVAPVSALVGNDGMLVTFDNWHSTGYGDDVVVIYRPDGTLVRKLGLIDLMDQDDINQLRRSVSSIQWSGEHRIDEERRLLILQIAAGRIVEMPLSLDTGELLVPRQALFPPPLVTWAGGDAPICDGGDAVTGAVLQEHAVTAAVPAYPPVAWKARIAGTVIVDLTIDERGAVEKVVVVKPLPFGLDQAAYDAVRQWTFRPRERDGIPVKMCGQVRMTFDARR